MEENKIPKQDEHDRYKARHDSFAGKLFWGLLFILIGGLFLASNFGVVKVHFDNVWKLWPLVIVVIGLSILSVRNIIWRIVSVVIVILSILAIGYVAVYGNMPVQYASTSIYQKSINKSSDLISSASVRIDSGANDLKIDSDDQTSILVATLKSSTATLKSDFVTTDNKQNVNLSTNDNNRWWLGASDNLLNVNLTRQLPIDLSINTGASNNTMDLSKVLLTSLNVDAGASNFDIKLGDNEKKMSVDLQAGASSIKIKSKDGLSSTSLDGFSKKDDNYYQTENYVTSSDKIDIVSETGVSSINIDRY
jgi:hypothetical protein